MNSETVSLRAETLTRSIEARERAPQAHRRPPATVIAAVSPAKAQVTDTRLTAVVVNYNAGDLLTECVRALLASALRVDVVVVDNASDDDSLATLETACDGDDRLTVIRRGDNGGFAVAVNEGLRATDAPWVAVINPDCIVRPDTLATLLANAADERTGMVGGLLLNPDGSEQRGCRRQMPTPGNTLARVLGLHRLLGRRWDFNLTGSPLPEEPVEIGAISGALMVARRDACAEVGPLDEGYFLHCEDLDWCRRFCDSGWRIRFVPDAIAVHHQGACSRRAPLKVLWYKHLGMVRYFRKFHGRGIAALVVSGVIWGRFGVAATARIAAVGLRRVTAAAQRS